MSCTSHEKRPRTYYETADDAFLQLYDSGLTLHASTIWPYERSIAEDMYVQHAPVTERMPVSHAGQLTTKSRGKVRRLLLLDYVTHLKIYCVEPPETQTFLPYTQLKDTIDFYLRIRMMEVQLTI